GGGQHQGSRDRDVRPGRTDEQPDGVRVGRAVRPRCCAWPVQAHACSERACVLPRRAARRGWRVPQLQPDRRVRGARVGTRLRVRLMEIPLLPKVVELTIDAHHEWTNKPDGTREKGELKKGMPKFFCRPISMLH